MYLTSIEKNTGLVDIELDRDGFYAIPEFRKILNLTDKKESDYGRKVFTVVALVVDYESSIRFYNHKEKPAKAEDIVFLRRNVILFNSPEIQEAMIAYSKLQLSLELEEKRMLDEMKADKLQEINNTDNKETAIKMRLFGDLDKINTQIKKFNEEYEDKDLFSASPVRNGYTLGRLEQKLLNKNSFYYVEQREPESAS